VASSRTIIIAGAGIGGLTAALALAKKGFRVSVIEQSARIEEIGAGIQLPPNAMNVLFALGLGFAMRPNVVVPEGIRIMRAKSAQPLVRVPLGHPLQLRFGAPYWIIHRGDLQAALLEAVRANPDITLALGTTVEDFAIHANGVTVRTRRGPEAADQYGIALVGADGLWSAVRGRLGRNTPPRFHRRTAWRAMVPADAVPSEAREPYVNLWLGRNAHLVHYPIRGGAQINIVAIVRDRWADLGWNNAGQREEILRRFSRWSWAEPARAVLAAPEQWAKWTLYDRPPLRRWGNGPVTLLGDAAHPMLPFLAQGAAMAIEDAAVLAECLGAGSDDPAFAMRSYETMRRRRTAKAQRAARRHGRHYHLAGPAAALRNLTLGFMGGDYLLGRYDWLYGWRPGSKSW
jgi:salicylate hydroxylase